MRPQFPPCSSWGTRRSRGSRWTKQTAAPRCFPEHNYDTVAVLRKRNRLVRVNVDGVEIDAGIPIRRCAASAGRPAGPRRSPACSCGLFQFLPCREPAAGPPRACDELSFPMSSIRPNRHDTYRSRLTVCDRCWSCCECPGQHCEPLLQNLCVHLHS